jgi:hypothetical protein
MLPPRRPGYSVVLGELQDHNDQDDDHQHTDDRADQSSVHGPSLPNVLTGGSVSPGRGQIAPESYPSLQRKAGLGKD